MGRVSGRVKGLLRLVGFVFLLFALSLTARAAEYWEQAVAHIEADRYAEALDELNGLLASRPDDSFLLRLKGFTLIAQDRDSEAIPVLESAVEADPEDTAAHYYLGQAYAYSGYIDHAIQRLEYVQSSAPDSRYAEASGQLLGQLYGLAQTSGDGYGDKRWEMTAQLGAKYDDNVPARADNDPDDSPTSSWVYTLSGYGKYEFLRLDELAHPMRAGVSVSGYQSFHKRDAFEPFDLTSGTAKLFTTLRGDIAEQPYTVSVDTGATRARLDGDPYSVEYFVNTSLDLQLGDHFLPSLGYKYTDMDFENDSEFPEFFSRDGDEHVASAGANVYLLDNRLILGATYSYTTTDTRGSQFDVSSSGVDAFAYAALPGSFNLTLTGSYSEEDYEEFVPDPTRLDDVWTYGVTLDRKLLDGLKLSLSWTRTEAESNREFADYQREIVDLSVRYAF